MGWFVKTADVIAEADPANLDHIAMLTNETEHLYQGRG